MEMRDWITVGTLAVSMFSAWAAFEARNTAQRLEQTQFETETSVGLLEAAYREMTAAEPARAAVGCYFVHLLEQAEREARATEPFLVQQFRENVIDAGLLGASCPTRLEGLVAATAEDADHAEPAPTRATSRGYGADVEALVADEAEFTSNGAPIVEPQPDRLATPAPEAIVEAEPLEREIGTWHALVATYDTTPRGCDFARQDVAAFAELLARQGFADRPISILRTEISDNYVVSVDAGDDRGEAARISAAIRSAAAAREGDTKTGSDSYVLGNRGWTVDPACDVALLIPG